MCQPSLSSKRCICLRFGTRVRDKCTLRYVWCCSACFVASFASAWCGCGSWDSRASAVSSLSSLVSWMRCSCVQGPQMETCSHVCSLRMAAIDVANLNRSLQTTSRMCIWKKARACLLFVPRGVECTIGSAFSFCCVHVWVRRCPACMCIRVCLSVQASRMPLSSNVNLMSM